ncbi:hypothetical protein SM124_16195 [Bacillus sp. 31A1R]|uniref:DUF4025 domain-containing protein n=1 Tax=Robertmurraya mangrovi TaxID=3098077 RepID=A0ABU5J1I7_9BACI|nr:hypothetical protein [Bacillus sp. 31A1R]MDZ5473259.1 hypothetical protein [Bacillus sp. 31A1R]
MKSRNEQSSYKRSNLEEALENNADNQSVSSQKDGFRYDYDDSAEITNEH